MSSASAGASWHRRIRQRAAVELAVGRDRERRHRQHCFRDQVVRQLCAESRTQFCRLRSASLGWNHIRRECPLPGAVFANGDGCASHVGKSQQSRFDLARLDPETADLDLVVRTPGEVQRSIRAGADEVAGAVHPAAFAGERVGDEPFRGHRRLPCVPARDSRAADVEFTDLPLWYRPQAVVQHVGSDTEQWPSDRHIRSEAGRIADGVAGREHRGLRGAVTVDHRYPRTRRQDTGYCVHGYDVASGPDLL